MGVQENRHRQVWPTQVGGFLVSIGFLTGLANMAFFPSAVCAHGQTGNFVAVYFICMLMVGFPLAYLHLSLGQFSGCNPINVFEKLCPAFKGIGWSWLLLTAPLLIISNMNAVWSLYYMFLSGKALVTDTPLPWAHQHRYTLEHTEPVGTIQEFLSGAEKERNTTTEDPQIVLRTPLAQDFRPPTPDYYHHLYHTSAPDLVLSIDSEMNIARVIDKNIVLGGMQQELVMFLVVSWIFVSVCTIHNSVNTMNRIVYVTAAFPMLILVILFARVIWMPGAWDGISMLIPEIKRFDEIGVWQDAITLIFLDMQIGVGMLISIAKHNRFHTDVFRDSILLVVINTTVSIVSACVAFGFIGFLARQVGSTDIRAMCRGQEAPHLLWDQILRSMTYMNSNEGPAFCFLYQLMLALGGIECSFTMCECVASALDYKISFLGQRPRVLRALVGIVMFVLTLPCCFQSGGVHVFNLLVHYSMHWNLKVIALCQFVVIGYFYGVGNLMNDIRLMLRLPEDKYQGSLQRIVGPTGTYIRNCWIWVCPAVITFALIVDLLTQEDELVPRRAGDSSLWHVLSIASILPLPAIIIYHVYIKDKNAFKTNRWKELGIPYGESTIASSLLTHTTELEFIRADEKPMIIHPVNFVLNTLPYISIPTTTVSDKNYPSDDEPYCSSEAISNSSDNDITLPADNLLSITRQPAFFQIKD